MLYKNVPFYFMKGLRATHNMSIGLFFVNKIAFVFYPENLSSVGMRFEYNIIELGHKEVIVQNVI